MTGEFCPPSTLTPGVGGGGFSGVRHWAAYRSHGDLFPVAPDWIECGLEQSGVSFPRRGAWSARALNTLAMRDPNSDFDQKLRYVPPTKTQESMAGRMIRCFSDAGSPPEGMTPLSAFDELGGGKSLYNEEPKNLAAYDFKKLKVLHSTLHPRSLDTVLPHHSKSILRRFSTMIEKSKDELHAGGPIDIVPYWDPKLKKSNGELDRLVVGLANQGLITFRVGIKERIGMFFVKKKTPEWIRLVIDARRVNASHKDPPGVRLSTPRSYLDVQFPPADNGPLAYGIEADVNDCFYNYFTEHLASWFGIDRPNTLAFWKQRGWKPSKLFDESQGRYVEFSDETVMYPVFRGLCMGWSWSLYFANERVAHIVSGQVPRPLQEIRDKQPTPSILDGPITGVYVDNISIIGRTKAETELAAKNIAEHFQQLSIPLTWTKPEASTVFETVGIILDFERGEVRNKPKRLWKAFMAGQMILSRRRITTCVLEVWLGHMTSLFMLAPCGLSCFSSIYRYIQSYRGRRSTLWGSVRQEIRNALGVMWLTCSNLTFDPVRQLDVGDSSSGAFALLTTWASISEGREVWRYIALPETVKEAAASGSRQKVVDALHLLQQDRDDVVDQEIRPCRPFGAGLLTRYADWLVESIQEDKSWLRTSSVVSQLRAKPKRRLQVDVPAMVQPVDPALCMKSRYSLLWRKRWRSSGAHINIKEASVCLSSLKRTARVASLHGRMKVTLTDNLPALFSFERGRSSSHGMNNLCRQAAAYQLGSGVKWRLRHVETLRNPADEDSRFHQHRGVRATRLDELNGNSAVSFGHGEHQSKSSSAPSGFGASTQNGAFLEIFSGSGRLSAAVRESGGLVAQQIDILNGSHHDLRRRASQLVVLSWLRSKRIKCVHLGTPCTVFSRARHNISNIERSRERERTGVELGLFTAEVIETCNRYNIMWSLENPRSSRLFELPFLAELLQSKDVFRVELDYCEYGEPFMKPTSIFTNFPELVKLGRRCTHKKHSTVLRGSERVKVDNHWVTAPRTRRAGAYPLELVKLWAQIIRPVVSHANRDTSCLVSQWRHELFSACQKKEVRRGAVSVPVEWDFLSKAFNEQIGGQGHRNILFGQHSAQEVQKRRRQLQKAVKEESNQKNSFRF